MLSHKTNVQKSKRPIGLSLTGLVWVQCRKTLQRLVEMVAISSFTNKKAYTSFASGTTEVLLIWHCKDTVADEGSLFESLWPNVIQFLTPS